MPPLFPIQWEGPQNPGATWTISPPPGIGRGWEEQKGVGYPLLAVWLVQSEPLAQSAFDDESGKLLPADQLDPVASLLLKFITPSFGVFVEAAGRHDPPNIRVLRIHAIYQLLYRAGSDWRVGFPVFRLRSEA